MDLTDTLLNEGNIVYNLKGRGQMNRNMVFEPSSGSDSEHSLVSSMERE